MPHLTLQFSDNVTPPGSFGNLFGMMHREMRNHAGIRVGNCKSRVVPCEHSLVGDGGEEVAFVHLEVALLSGRSGNDLKRLGESLLDLLRKSFSGPAELQVTVEIREMPREFYFKHPASSLVY